jgi:hypothetical protein
MANYPSLFGETFAGGQIMAEKLPMSLQTPTKYSYGHAQNMWMA